jgi:hypothetical protein
MKQAIVIRGGWDRVRYALICEAILIVLFGAATARIARANGLSGVSVILRRSYPFDRPLGNPRQTLHTAEFPGSAAGGTLDRQAGQRAGSQASSKNQGRATAENTAQTRSISASVSVA